MSQLWGRDADLNTIGFLSPHLRAEVESEALIPLAYRPRLTRSVACLPVDTHDRPQTALILYETLFQLLAFKEEEISAEFGRLSSRIAGQNVEFAAAEVEADVTTAVAETHTNAPGH